MTDGLIFANPKELEKYFWLSIPIFSWSAAWGLTISKPYQQSLTKRQTLFSYGKEGEEENGSAMEWKRHRRPFHWFAFDVVQWSFLHSDCSDVGDFSRRREEKRDLGHFSIHFQVKDVVTTCCFFASLALLFESTWARSIFPDPDLPINP